MRLFARRFVAQRSFTLSTFVARRRLDRAMPGEMGSMASLRLTGISL